jgi:uncharacterized protein (UPF0335 family)
LAFYIGCFNAILFILQKFEGFKNDLNLEYNMADVGGIAGERLRAFVERVERLEEEKAALAADIKEVYAEAKGVGFDIKILRKIISLRKLDRSDRLEQEELLDIYMRALDME